VGFWLAKSKKMSPSTVFMLYCIGKPVKGGVVVPADKYELVALVARYWFAFLGVIIVWRSFMWLRKDARRKRKRLKQLPDAGLVGELVVLAGSETLPPGTVISLPREGTLGSLRSCDVCVPCPGVASHHGDFRFVDGVGLIVTPAAQLTVMVDGQEPGPAQREWVLHHGSRIAIGDAVLRMRLFMGLETARSAAFQQDAQDYGMLPDVALVREEWRDGEEADHPVYEPAPPVVFHQGFAPGWEDDTRPYRQQVLSWGDTARYEQEELSQTRRYQVPFVPNPYDDELNELNDGGGEVWPDPHEGEQHQAAHWQQAQGPVPPPRRRLFQRRRR